MTGAESLISTLANEGIEVCFANPGSSEMHFLAALGDSRFRGVLCLFEGVATGAADGWYRMKDHPASTLLHLGPGLANGLANIHNAKRAGSGMVNIIGEHATPHLRYNSPLTSDIEGLARPLCHWVRRADSSYSLSGDAMAAVAQARAGRISALILPGETSWGPAGEPAASNPRGLHRAAPPAARVEHVARILSSREPTLMIFGGMSTRGAALDLAGRVAARTRCRIGSQFFTSRIERGAGRVPLERIPYYVPAALEFLKDFRHIITVETGEPIAFFNYPEKPSQLKPPDCAVHTLVETGEDSIAGLEMLIDALGARGVSPVLQTKSEQAIPDGPLDPKSIAQALAAALPENAILVDESLTTGRETLGLTAGALPHDVLQNLGGSIGFGTPVATGAAMACPDRRTFCMVGDGSAMYTIQSLWTQARESLNVTTIVFANHSYKILKVEFGNMGFGTPGPKALELIDMDRPRIDWVAMGKSMGVPSVRVENARDFYLSMVNSAKEPGPMLIEVAL